MGAVEKTRMTVEEFKQLPESNLPTELIDGELIVSPAPLDPHQRASWSMVGYLASMKLPGIFRHAPTDVHIGDDVVQPDIFWIRENSTNCIQQDNRWYGAPDLIIEILSPSTAHRDRSKKYTIYEQHGVREYWLVDPEALFVEVYIRKDDQFARHGVFGVGETFVCAVLAVTIDVSALLGQGA
jgi:Uma2 family endonuclease